MSGRRGHEDEAIRTQYEGEPAPGLEGLPRADMAPLEASLPSLVDGMVRGPVILTRNGKEAFVLLPLDVYRRLWFAAPRPPVLDMDAGSET